MKISKYNHSCLLIEDSKILLIDPGTFSEPYKGHFLAQPKLDAILVTHDHTDHFSLPLVKELHAKFPTTVIISNQPVVDKLKAAGIPAQIEPIDDVTLTDAPHERMFYPGPMSPNILFTVFNRLTHPGDSFHISQTAEILALPITAPWGSTVEAVNKALELKPKIIIPIHDAMMKDEVVEGFLYPSLSKFFAQHEIDFKGIKNGEIIEV